MPPIEVMDLMNEHMGLLLQRSEYTSSYAHIVFERINRINLTFKGKAQQPWDMPTLVPEHTPSIFC